MAGRRALIRVCTGYYIRAVRIVRAGIPPQETIALAIKRKGHNMKYLFLNNFRGFLKTFVPIFDVNFLVGENSTGKTSMMRILKLLSLPEFWFKLDFSAEDVEFSHFTDIVSMFSEEKRFFDIGLMNVDGSNQELSAFLMTFTKIKGSPSLSVLTYMRKKRIFRIRFLKSAIKYKKIDFSEHLLTDDEFEKIFYTWLLDHKNDTKGYKVLKLQKRTSLKEIPLIILTELIENIFSNEISEKQEKKGKKREITLGRLRTLLPLVFFQDIAWIAPIRTKPRRTYDMYKLEFSSEGDHTPYLIKKILGRDADAKKFKNFIKEIGENSGLFDDVIIKRYGRGATAPFELDVMLNNKNFSICSVGYGVSQSLPVIVELFARPKNTWYAIQQPEVHLHPKAQAALGTLFFHMASMEGKKFLIETHSDYLIDRFRINYGRDKNNNILKAQILFFQRDEKGNKIFPLSIGHDGNLPKEQPPAYRDFFIKEQMALLGI